MSLIDKQYIMSYPKYIDLNIGINILSHLTIEDALKEIISNAYDEHILSKIKKDSPSTDKYKKALAQFQKIRTFLETKYPKTEIHNLSLYISG